MIAPRLCGPAVRTRAATIDRPSPSPLPRELWRHLAWGADYPGVAELWPRWCALVDDLTGTDVELTVEDFAPALAMFRRLERIGVIFDEAFAGFMRRLEYDGIGTSADTDRDDADELLDLEDGDSDTSDADDEPDFPATHHRPPVDASLRRMRLAVSRRQEVRP